ncbi:MAG: alpha/beta fold hydrolase [Gammaproteobacteria bacterium]|nr:alpha/beta fold hydrolase [Gammaproteobacteria bacterium]
MIFSWWQKISAVTTAYPLALLLILSFAGKSTASDLLREQRIADEIEEAILVGYPLRLTAEGIEFLAIHTEATTPQVHGAAVLLHGHGANPDWTDVIQPLRSTLPDRGWETLSIQLPVASADAADGSGAALIPESFPRIGAAIDFLLKRGVKSVVVVGHSLGARMGVEYSAAGDLPTEVRGLVAIGLSADRQQRDSGTLLALSNMRLPLLDIYGSRDAETVLNSVGARLTASQRGGNAGYRQLEVNGANHFFSGMDEELVARVNAWMRKVAQSAPAQQQ